MNNKRKTSIDPVLLKDWPWIKFLNTAIDSLTKFNFEPYPIAEEFLDNEKILATKSSQTNLRISTWACQAKKIRQVRAACVSSDHVISVLNFVINPYHTFDLPFFGADFVTLPSGHLLALDLQPVLKNDKVHTDHVWEKLVPLKDSWQELLPWGGEIPKDAKQFFSPGFLWTRLPLGNNSDRIIEEVIEPAFDEYLSLYLDLVEEAQLVMPKRSRELLKGQREYVKYRSEKDPARGMLSRYFGREWTESYIQGVLFDL